jgi:hypothetical protein
MRSLSRCLSTSSRLRSAPPRAGAWSRKRMHDWLARFFKLPSVPPEVTVFRHRVEDTLRFHHEAPILLGLPTKDSSVGDMLAMQLVLMRPARSRAGETSNWADGRYRIVRETDRFLKNRVRICREFFVAHFHAGACIVHLKLPGKFVVEMLGNPFRRVGSRPTPLSAGSSEVQ